MEIVRILLTLVLFGVSLVMIFLILIQKSKGGGIGAAFGGAGSDSILGPAGGNKITTITTLLAVIFILLSMTLTFFLRPEVTIDTIVGAEPGVTATQPAAPGGEVAPPPDAGDAAPPSIPNPVVD